MSETQRGPLAKVFIAMMLFCLLCWVWTVALIMSWPYDKTSEWKPDARLPVVCADGDMCSIAYADLADALAQNKISSLIPKERAGEISDPDAYLSWKSVTDKPWQYEANLSSWYFETTVRYNLKGNVPELVQYRHYDGGIFFYAIPAALFSLLGIYLRKLRG